MKVLITGGAGFIGSHLADKLISDGHNITIFDNLDPQIHPFGKPKYLNKEANFYYGDVRNRDQFENVLSDVDVIYHFAAAVGTGQSMYQIKKYTDINIGGLATLLDILVDKQIHPKIIYASSATSYGECAHKCKQHGIFYPELRTNQQLIEKQWNVICPECKKESAPIPISESQPLQAKFVYGINKKTGEELLSAVSETYNIPYTILRFFNVYGPRQSLLNPYTGVIAIFNALLKNNKSPLVIEDGDESRDFISIHDIVRACMLVLKNSKSNNETFNIGTGEPTKIFDLANLIVDLHHSPNKPTINGKFRKNDFRHSIADISKIKKVLGFSPKISLRDGLQELHEWTRTQESSDNFKKAYKEMEDRGLI